MREHQYSIAELIERDRLAREADAEARLDHDELIAARDRAAERAPLAAWHPWRAEAQCTDPQHPALAEAQCTDPQHPALAERRR